jgi:acetate kinase
LASIRGQADALGQKEACVVIHRQEHHESIQIPYGDHAQALPIIFSLIQQDNICAVGHRIVHGGEYFSNSVVIDDHVLTTLEKCITLAPLHNPANILGIKSARKHHPNIPNIAVFDTAFHQTIPEKAYRYALPEFFYQKHHIRRYGFHGTSLRYVLETWCQHQHQLLEKTSVIIAHLGNGASVTAVAHGQSVDTSMGFTPLEGLVMGSRVGDIDAGISLYLMNNLGLNAQEIDTLYNKESGLMGLSGLSNDCRTLEQAEQEGHTGASLALSVFCYRLAKTIASYWPALPSIDAVIFTGGIGEHSQRIRMEVLKLLSTLGIIPCLTPPTRGQITCISTSESLVPVWIVPTNEEIMIAQDTWRLLSQ